MKVLVVGGGGREHALVWKLKQDDPAVDVIAAPGNPGIATLARCVPIAPTDLDALVALAEAEHPDLTIVGPEGPLDLGLVDRFRARGLAIFGPTAAAARIESSKVFAKKLMLDAGVPTARAVRHVEARAAKLAARDFGAPVVIKVSGLAAGKGVFVAETLADADAAIDAILTDHAYGAAGGELLVEEFMSGEEVSLLVVTNGTDWVPLIPAQDHKRLLDGDRGPNTGGMGAYAPAVVGTEAQDPWLTVASNQIIAPTLEALRDRGAPFSGVLYAGLMLTSSGPRVVEFNCRMGDPETQAILPITREPLLPLFRAAASGEPLPNVGAARKTPEFAVTTVLAAAGYPEQPRVGDVIDLPPDEPGIHVFHAGTGRNAAGQLVTAGGRVLAVTAVGRDLATAQRASAAFAGRINFRGKHFRTDIASRGVGRHA